MTMSLNLSTRFPSQQPGHLALGLHQIGTMRALPGNKLRDSTMTPPVTILSMPETTSRGFRAGDVI